ncbi:MAG: hypothetical protein NTX53_21975 [candidate division WOR-3 bacterium]|nr:hypothetical protein [candidate division WOR-3 bacterium]
MHTHFTIIAAAFAGCIAALSAELQPSVRFSPYLSVDYGRGSTFWTSTPIWEDEGLVFSGFGVNGGGRLTLTSGRLFTFAQLDFVNLNNLFTHDSVVAFMVSQSAGWTADELTLDAGFHYSESFNRDRSGLYPIHRMYAGYAEARESLGRFDFGVNACLLHREGIVTIETDLAFSIDASYHFAWCAPYVGVGRTSRRIWKSEHEYYMGGPSGSPLYASAGVCITPFGHTSDFQARMLIPRRVTHWGPYVGR